MDHPRESRPEIGNQLAPSPPQGPTLSTSRGATSVRMSSRSNASSKPRQNSCVDWRPPVRDESSARRPAQDADLGRGPEPLGAPPLGTVPGRRGRVADQDGSQGASGDAIESSGAVRAGRKTTRHSANVSQSCPGCGNHGWRVLPGCADRLSLTEEARGSTPEQAHFSHGHSGTGKRSPSFGAGRPVRVRSRRQRPRGAALEPVQTHRSACSPPFA